jgi:site-specific recombinase XerD
MNGKIEQENRLKKKIAEKLATLPRIFSEFYNYMEADQKSYATIKHYIEYVSNFMDVVAKDENKKNFYQHVTVAEIREYMISLKRRVEDGKEVQNSDSIQATRWSAINCFFEFLVMDDYIETNPMVKTKRPKNRKEKPIIYLEHNEIDAIMTKIREESKPQFVNRDLAIVSLGIGTGIRVGALVQINVEDIDFRENTVHVIEKGGKDRYIKFGANTRNILAAWLVDRSTYFEVETDALFVSQWQQRLTTEGVRKLIAKYADGINGKHITAHTMRKSAATNMAKAGVDIQTIADMLNHANIQTTRKYAAVLDEAKQKATNALDEMFQ